MAGTTSRKTEKEASPAFDAGPPNMNLVAARRAARKLADQRWKQITVPTQGVDVLEFVSAPEWMQSIRFHYEPTGFNYTGDPEVRRAKNVADGPVVNVAVALQETEEDVVDYSPVEYIDWDEIDPAPTYPEPALPKVKVLELYEPAHPAKSTHSETVEAVPETRKPEPEEVFVAPALRDSIAQPKIALRLPPAIPALAAQEPVAPSGSRIHMPAAAFQPLRRRIISGPSPEMPAPVEKAEPAQARVAKFTAGPAVEEIPVVAEPLPKAAEETPQPVETAPVAREIKPAVEKAPPPVEARQEQPASGRKKKKQQRGAARESDEPIEEPANLGDDIEASLAASVRTEEDDAPAYSAPAAEISFGGLADSKISAAEAAGTGLSLSSTSMAPPSAGMGAGAKVGIAAAILAIAAGIAYVSLGDDTGQKKAAAPAATSTSAFETLGNVLGEAGWSTDVSSDSAGKKTRQISLYRPTQKVNDYRVEFEGDIEYKAVSWVVRAASMSSYWVLKLTNEKGQIKFTRQLLKDGEPGDLVTKDLPFAASLTTTFRVRTDVAGNRFRVTVQDAIVDEWTSKELPTGGFGIANEGAERGQVRSVQVFHLRERNPQK